MIPDEQNYRILSYTDNEGKVRKIGQKFVSSLLLNFVPSRRKSTLFTSREKIYYLSYLIILIWLSIFAVGWLVIYYPIYWFLGLFWNKLAKIRK